MRAMRWTERISVESREDYIRRIAAEMIVRIADGEYNMPDGTITNHYRSESYHVSNEREAGDEAE